MIPFYFPYPPTPWLINSVGLSKSGKENGSLKIGVDKVRFWLLGSYSWKP
jgi:hypothetical protein